MFFVQEQQQLLYQMMHQQTAGSQHPGVAQQQAAAMAASGLALHKVPPVLTAITPLKNTGSNTNNKTGPEKNKSKEKT